MRYRRRSPSPSGKLLESLDAVLVNERQAGASRHRCHNLPVNGDDGHVTCRTATLAVTHSHSVGHFRMQAAATIRIFYSPDEKSARSVSLSAWPVLRPPSATTALRGLVRVCAYATERMERPRRPRQELQNKDKAKETDGPEISLTVGRQDGTAETNTARKTIMITTGRRTRLVYQQRVLRHEFICVSMDDPAAPSVHIWLLFVVRFDGTPDCDAQCCCVIPGASPTTRRVSSLYTTRRRHRSDSLPMRSSRR